MTETLLAIALAAAALCPNTWAVNEDELRRAALKANIAADGGADPEQLERAARIACAYGSRREGKRLLQQARDWRHGR